MHRVEGQKKEAAEVFVGLDDLEVASVEWQGVEEGGRPGKWSHLGGDFVTVLIPAMSMGLQ